jgi:4-hydroxy-tetrahydrodipicolinate reductase
MTYRVALWGTGWAGRQAIPGILEHPDLELAGVYVTSPEKDGRDVGDLAGIAPIGLRATTDVDRIMDLQVDCHLVMLLGHRPHTAAAVVNRICALLEAGQNVSQTSIVPLYYPKYAPAAMREQVEAACRSGSSRCYGTGVFPGVVSDVIPMALLAGSERVDRIRITEMLNYLEYYGAAEARLSGIGESLESGLERARRVAVGTKDLVSAAILHLAERLDVQIDEIRTGLVDVAPAHKRVEVETLIIEPGTVGALRHITEGHAGGRSVIELQFVTRYDNAAGPDWPAPAESRTGCYRIEIEGSLSIGCDLNLVGRRRSSTQTRGFARESPQLGAYIMTTAPAVNAVPFLCAAEPGLYGSMDLDRSHDLHVIR